MRKQDNGYHMKLRILHFWNSNIFPDRESNGTYHRNKVKCMKQYMVLDMEGLVRNFLFRPVFLRSGHSLKLFHKDIKFIQACNSNKE